MSSFAAAKPRLVVLDLDATVWTPELHRVRRFAAAADPSWRPKAGVDVKLCEGAAQVLRLLATSPEWRETRVAVASRTAEGEWARALLREFEV